MARCWDCSDRDCRVCPRHLRQVEDFNNMRLERRIREVVGEVVKTRQVELKLMETDPNWWELHMMFHKN